MSTALTDDAKNALLESTAGTPAWPPSYLSLHDGNPGSVGANEISGGTPPYARQAIGWNSAVSGERTMSTQPEFDVPAGTTVRYAGMWSAASGGTFWGYSPVGSASRRAFAGDASTDTLTSPAHGYADDDQVVVWAGIGAGLPTGIVEGTVYWVISSATDTLQLALSQGGVAIDLTAAGDGDLQLVTPETFSVQGTYSVPSLAVSLPG